MNKHLKVAIGLSELLDNKFKIGRFSFGIDPLLGAIPGIGDAITLCLSLYVVWIGIKMNLPSEKLAKMIGNLVLDFVLGTIPIIGDIGDFFYKANIKNMEILKKHAETIEEGEIIKE